jgi:acyl-CoA synthetase (NDP forming)
MSKLLTRQTFGVLEHKSARVSEAKKAYKTKLRELEQQFESKAAALREAYLAAVLEIHEVATSSFAISNNPLQHQPKRGPGTPPSQSRSAFGIELAERRRG